MYSSSTWTVQVWFRVVSVLLRIDFRHRVFFSSPKIAPEDFTAAYEWRVDGSCGIFDASMMASFDVQYVKPCAVATLCKLEQ